MNLLKNSSVPMSPVLKRLETIVNRIVNITHVPRVNYFVHKYLVIIQEMGLHLHR